MQRSAIRPGTEGKVSPRRTRKHRVRPRGSKLLKKFNRELWFDWVKEYDSKHHFN